MERAKKNKRERINMYLIKKASCQVSICSVLFLCVCVSTTINLDSKLNHCRYFYLFILENSFKKMLYDYIYVLNYSTSPYV